MASARAHARVLCFWASVWQNLLHCNPFCFCSCSTFPWSLSNFAIQFLGSVSLFLTLKFGVECSPPLDSIFLWLWTLSLGVFASALKFKIWCCVFSTIDSIFLCFELCVSVSVSFPSTLKFKILVSRPLSNSIFCVWNSLSWCFASPSNSKILVLRVLHPWIQFFCALNLCASLSTLKFKFWCHGVLPSRIQFFVFWTLSFGVFASTLKFKIFLVLRVFPLEFNFLLFWNSVCGVFVSPFPPP